MFSALRNLGSKKGQADLGKSRKRYLFSESQGVERTKIFLEFDLNEHSVLAALLIHCKNFCGNRSHFSSLSTSGFAGDGDPSLTLQIRRKTIAGVFTLSHCTTFNGPLSILFRHQDARRRFWRRSFEPADSGADIHREVDEQPNCAAL
jgi:hypothetical protein